MRAAIFFILFVLIIPTSVYASGDDEEAPFLWAAWNWQVYDGKKIKIIGGTGPYTIESTCGEFNEYGIYSDPSGCCGRGTYKVTDSLGAFSQMEFANTQICSMGDSETLYSLRYYPATPYYRLCSGIIGTSWYQQGFFCSDNSGVGGKDADGDSIPPVSLGCAKEICSMAGYDHAVAWSLSKADLVCEYPEECEMECPEGDSDADGVCDGQDQCPDTPPEVEVDADGCPNIQCTDNDGDGFSIEGGECGSVDCDDTDPKVNSGEGKICSQNGDCKNNVRDGSSGNVVTGEQKDNFNLFGTFGTGLTVNFSLYYNSRDAFKGSIGQSWGHSYEFQLKELFDQSVRLRSPSGRYYTYTPSGNGYSSQPGDFCTLSKNADDAFLLTKTNGTVYSFNENNRIASIIDRNGNSLTFSYDGDDLVEIVESSGRVTILSYDGKGELVSVTDPAGRVYGFSVGDTLDSITLPDGNSWHFTYEGNAFMSTKLDPVGDLTSYYYDSQHRVIETVSPEGQIRTFDYPEEDNAVRTTTFTEKDDSEWLYTYETDRGLLLSKTDPEGNVTSYTYDDDRNMTSKTEPGVGITTYTYDSSGNMTSVSDPAGSTTGYTYNTYGQILTVTDSDDNVTSYEYDEKGNLLSVTAPDGAMTSYAYNDQGQMVSITDAGDRTTSLSYDAAGNVKTVTGPDGSTTTFEYDAAGNRTKVIDADGNETRYEYDAVGNLVKVIDSAGKETNYVYDANGNRIQVTDANGKVTTFGYNSQGQMISMTDSLGNTTTFQYNGSSGCSVCGGGVDKLTALTDAKGQTTKFKYDVLGNLIKETDPLGNSTSYAYNTAGQVSSKTDANGNTISFNYDISGRLQSKTYPDGKQTTFGYDNRGNLTSAANQNIAYTFAYDTGNRLTHVSDDRGYELTYTYDASGNRTNIKGSFGINNTYSYDDSGRLATIASAAGNIDFNFDTLGRRNKLIFPNGVFTTYNYDDLGRLTDLMTVNGSNLITKALYTHDNVSNRLNKSDERTTMSYTYDDIYRLTEAVASTPGFSSDKGKGKNGKNNTNAMQNQKEYYQYDAVGNRTTSSEHNSYTYNAGNQLLSADATQYTYDANGNRTQRIAQDGITTYT